MAGDVNVEVLSLQNDIEKYLGLKGANLIFDYTEKDGTVKLDLITINPKHEQSFLYHSVKAIDKIDALKKMKEYVLEHHKYDNSYTIQWIIIGQNELQTSYFRAKNMHEALDKFYYGRNEANCKVFSIQLNPVS